MLNTEDRARTESPKPTRNTNLCSNQTHINGSGHPSHPPHPHHQHTLTISSTSSSSCSYHLNYYHSLCSSSQQYQDDSMVSSSKCVDILDPIPINEDSKLHIHYINYGNYDSGNQSNGDDSAANKWILQLRWHTENECCNVLQSKLFPDVDLKGGGAIDCANITSNVIPDDNNDGRGNKLIWRIPLSLKMKIIKCKYDDISILFQNIFKNLQCGMIDQLSQVTGKSMSSIILVLQQLLSILKHEQNQINFKSNQAVLIQLHQIVKQIENKCQITNSDQSNFIKDFLILLLEFAQLTTDLKQSLITISFNEWLDNFKKLVKLQSIQIGSVPMATTTNNIIHKVTNNSAEEDDVEEQSERSPEQQRQQQQQQHQPKQWQHKVESPSSTYILINLLLNDALLTISHEKSFIAYLIESRCVVLLVRICGLIQFMKNWSLCLSLYSELSSNISTAHITEKIKGFDILTSIIQSYTLPIQLLSDAAKLMGQLTSTIVSSQSQDQFKKWQNLYHQFPHIVLSLLNIGAMTTCQRTFAMTTSGINNLIYMFPESSVITSLFKHKQLHSLLVGFLLDKGQTELTKYNIINILCNMSVFNELRERMILCNVVELCLQLLGDVIQINCSTESEDTVGVIYKILRILLNLCCNDNNIELLVDNNHIDLIYKCSYYLSTQSKCDDNQPCRQLIETLISCLEAGQHSSGNKGAGSNKCIDIIVQLNNARESDV